MSWADSVVIEQQLTQVSQPLRYRFEHRVLGIQRRFLRHVAKLEVGRAPYSAVVGLSFSGNDLSRLDLPAPVAADQSDALSAVEQ